MYITNDPDVAKIAQQAGVDRIFVDMEYIGKDLRQKNMDTVQNRHSLDDIRILRSVLEQSELLVRCNPIHKASEEYSSSAEEIDGIIENGADIIMLPYFKTPQEVEIFVELVANRAKTMLLFETLEAIECIDDILQIDGIDELYIGLNDLSLSYGKRFMFELLSDGTVEQIIEKFKIKNLPYGFGGLACIDGGLLPGSNVVIEHYRLGSSRVILSRSFCDTKKVNDRNKIRQTFFTQIQRIRELEAFCREQNNDFFNENKLEIIEKIKHIKENL